MAGKLGLFVRRGWALSRQTWRSRKCYSATTFSELGLLPEVSEKLVQEGFVHPTDVQNKSLQPILEGKHVVLNAETGSGKTLCFLLPILQSLTRLSLTSIPAPYSIVLVPTPDLANQINNVFRSLANPEWGSSVVYSGSQLALKSSTHLVIGIPSCLVQYNLQKIVKDVQIMCVDEADVVLTGSEKKPAWDILKTMRELHRNDLKKGNVDRLSSSTNISFPAEHEHSNAVDLTKGSSDEISDAKEPFRQLLFTAATLPSGGPQTVHSLLKKWLPKSALFVATAQTHQTISTAEMAFVDIKDDSIHKSCSSDPESSPISKSKLTQMWRDLTGLQEETDDQNTAPRVLVFVNTITNANAVFNFLMDPESKNPAPWWKGKVGQLHKEITPDERKKTVQFFKADRLQVLVCTDLASRGLDIPGITTVIQFDFPVNSTDYLHRVGRTARAGSSGKVISYVGETDRDLATVIKKVLTNRAMNFTPIFSRNKMLRRKINRRKAKTTFVVQ